MNIKRLILVFLILLFAFPLTLQLFTPKPTSAKTPKPPPQWQPKLVSQSPDVGVPEVAYGSGKFGIVWSDRKDGSYEIFFALLDASGQKIGSDLRITNDLGNSMDPVIAFDGKDFGIFWYDNPAGSQSGIYFARVSQKGVLEVSPRRLNPPESVADHPSAVWNKKAGEYGVTWGDSRNTGVYFARVNKGGIPIKETPVGQAAGIRPLIATSGKEYGLTWTGWYDCGSSCPEVAFARVNRNGDTVGGVSIVTAIGPTSPHSIAWNGSGYGVLVTKDNLVQLLSLTPQGAVLHPPTDIGHVEASNAKMAWNGKEYGISWGTDQWVTPEHPTNGEVVFRKFDLLGNPLSDVVRVTENDFPSWSLSTPIEVGNKFALVWTDFLYEPNQAIYFAQGK